MHAQSIVDAHVKLQRTLMMDHAVADWHDYLGAAVEAVVKGHRSRGVCINKMEIRTILEEMATHIKPDALYVPPNALTDICARFSLARPTPHAVPVKLHNIAPGSMRSRRKILAHTRASMAH